MELCKPIAWMGEGEIQIGNGDKQGSSRSSLKTKCNTSLEGERGFFLIIWTNSHLEDN